MSALPVDNIGEKPVGQIAVASFFVLALIGAFSILFLTVKDHLAEIVAALRGELPARAVSRPWVRSVRSSVRPRPVVRAAARRAAA